ncbi:hypothetical protein [Nocardia sp. alder85J]|uniref:hypothetical protein n=1 Tax=Nocardia sp. alder85J TaxID=2862949 RepID=UPI001CD38493|nr:hypothetical protein [Nocardia sp. alder85J]MCX4094520.1 hypothetical protein [Nocardia sp. alder85J]
MTTETKICLGCGVEKPWDQYYLRKGRPQGQCRECIKTASNARYHALAAEVGHGSEHAAWEAGYRAALTDIKRGADGTPGHQYASNPYRHDHGLP